MRELESVSCRIRVGMAMRLKKRRIESGMIRLEVE